MLSLALFGGTFDPIHNGHLKTSLALQTHFHFDEFLFIPCKIPILKAKPQASQAQRIKMLQLALKDHPQFKLDLREIKRDTPSYMVETLESFRTEYPYAALNLILGFDSFLSLPLWYQWEKIINLANLLVLYRPQIEAKLSNKALKAILRQHQTEEETSLLTQEAGAIYFFDAGLYAVSSTQIRAQLIKSRTMPEQIPKSVQKYIIQEGLYR